MMINVFTDGGSRGNPGSAAIGIFIFKDANRINIGSPIGKGTNNDAEYLAFLNAVKILKPTKERVLFHSDSLLVVSQVTGKWKIKDKKIQGYVNSIKRGLSLFENYDIIHVARSLNSVADTSVNKALDANTTIIDTVGDLEPIIKDIDEPLNLITLDSLNLYNELYFLSMRGE